MHLQELDRLAPPPPLCLFPLPKVSLTMFDLGTSIKNIIVQRECTYTCQQDDVGCSRCCFQTERYKCLLDCECYSDDDHECGNDDDAADALVCSIKFN